jgi:hypothetical protein
MVFLLVDAELSNLENELDFVEAHVTSNYVLSEVNSYNPVALNSVENLNI